MSSLDDAIAADVDRVGWTCISIRDVDPPFAYTVGLMKTYDHPELIIFGRPDDAHPILSDLVGAFSAGTRLDQPGKYDVLDGFPTATRPVDESHHEIYLGYAMGFVRYMGRVGELAAVQIYVPDIDGLYPFESGCAEPVFRSQPRLDIPLTVSERKELETDE